MWSLTTRALMFCSGPGDRTRAAPSLDGCMQPSLDFGGFAHFSGLGRGEPLLLARVAGKDLNQTIISSNASGFEGSSFEYGSDYADSQRASGLRSVATTG